MIRGYFISIVVAACALLFLGMRFLPARAPDVDIRSTGLVFLGESFQDDVL
ncbi:hypothetical protein [Cyclonatronum proteinivorum]|uniref:hypothetical protein n=1 Tax=Cyclonatronum proteinivorum TaxID=1457365 RepID=UPI0013DF020E|nr:hypothetical protein [Cyclonatronum proteinivorum]